MYKRFAFLFLFFIVLFSGCTKKEEMKISANTWIGYTPLFYADAQGWLASENIKLIHTVSLNESLQLYNENLVNAMASTQYEAELANKEVYPVILLDKSYGADMVMSNYPLNRLKNFPKIDVYLEIDSVNSLLLSAFIKEYKIDKSKLNIQNRDQAQIVVSDYKKPTILITYSPYDTKLRQKGFKILASTKTSSALIVLDAVFSDDKNIKEHHEQFVKLKKFVDLALKDLKKNPKHFFNVVQPYLGYEYKYSDFINDLNNIKWLNRYDLDTKEILKQLNLDSSRLVK